MADLIESSLIDEVTEWFETAVPSPSKKNIHTQLGCHLEEVGEMLNDLIARDINTDSKLHRATHALQELADHLKANHDVVDVPTDKRLNFLKEICDQIVTGVGIAYMLEMDVTSALSEVNSSNWSKFTWFGSTAIPVFDADQKIVKGPGYHKADLSSFV